MKIALVLLFLAAGLFRGISAGEQAISEQAQANLEQGIAFLREGKVSAACEQFKTAIRRDRNLSKAYVYLGIGETQLQRFADAELALRQALKLDENSEVAHYNLALSLLGLQKPEEAVREFRVVVRLNPRIGPAHYNLALLLAQQGNLKEALNHLETARSIQPDDPAVLVHLTDFYLRSGNDTVALQLAAEATKLDSDGSLSIALGKVLVEGKCFKEALPLLDKAQSLLHEEASWELYDVRGSAAMGLDQREEATEAFLKAISMRPAEASPHYHFGRLLLSSKDRKERTNGVGEINEAIRLDSAQTEYYLTLANYYFDTGNLKPTIKLLTSALDHVPPSVQIYVTLGLAELELEGPTPAEPFIEKVIALDPQAGAGYDLLGRCRMRVDDYASAAKYYIKAAKLTPGNDIYLRDAAIALDKLGQSAEGLPFAEQSVNLRPDQVYNHYILGKLYSQTGNRTSAIRELQICVDLNPQNALPYNLLATLYKRAGEEAKAESCWRTLRSLKQQDTEQAERAFSRLGSVPQ